jgi:hypothetical protein
MSTKVYKKNLTELIKFIDQKRFAVPEFQRGFVWHIAHVKKLFDSLVKKYPIGSFILWETKQKIDARTINGDKLPTKKFLILDGQQRILSLYYLSKQKVFSQHAVRDRFHQISEAKHSQLIDFEKFHMVNNNGVPSLEYDSENKNEFNFKKFQKLLGKSYRFPVVIVSLNNYRNAIEVFERINQAGTRISTESIFLSETWGKYCDFAKILRKWRKENGSSITKDIDTIIFIHVFSLIFQLEYNKKSIARDSIGIDIKTLKKIAEIVRAEKSKKYDFEFKKVVQAVAKAVSYLTQEYNIKKLSDLPSQTMITVLSIFFLYRKDLSNNQKTELRKWFWRSALQNRYIGSGYNKNIGSDALGMKKLALTNRHLNIPFKKVNPSDFDNVELKAGRSTMRNVLRQALWQQTPIFINGSKIMRQDKEVKHKNPEHDHFYPYDLYAKGILGNEANHIFNLHLLDGDENVTKGKKIPSEWLRERVEKINAGQREIENYFKSELLPFKSLKELEKFDRVFKNKYEKCSQDQIRKKYALFLRKRFKLLSDALTRLQMGKSQ